MHGAEYQAAALRTESQDFEAIKRRLSNPQLVRSLLYTLRKFLSASNDLDKIKKHLFYGKDLEGKLLSVPITKDDMIFPEGNSTVVNLQVLLKYNVLNLRKLHAVLGVASESGELVEMMLNFLTLNTQYDDLSWIKEWGDVVWYAAEGASSVSSDLDTVFVENIKKLKVRYPDLFSETLAQNHDGA